MKVRIISPNHLFLLIFCIMFLAAGCHSLNERNTISNNDISNPIVSIPGSSSPTVPFEINNHGSYYLAGNRLCKGTGIIINSDNVTLDFMGYELAGPGKCSGENYGILTNNYRNLEVRNGTIRNFGDRGIVDRGKEQQSGYKRIINMRIISNGQCGICIGGPGNLIKNCNCSNNGVSGMCPGYGCIVIENICNKNKNNGIHAGRACLIAKNSISENGQSGILAYSGSTIINNTVYANNTSEDVNSAGIYISHGCVVKDNTVRDNNKNNMFVSGSGNLIKDNSITADKILCNGIYFKSNQNVYLDNSLSGNKVDFDGNTPSMKDK
jgi:hypothetical protein